MKFWLGTHQLAQKWWDARVPLFVSRRGLTRRKTLPEARVPWAKDSGGFTELSMFGEWRTTEDQYVADTVRFRDEIGMLDWVAPMDWMCEPHMLEKTGRTVLEHQILTIGNFLRLRDRLGELVIPVLQGWKRDDYLRCWELYDSLGVDLEDERLVGLGSVCRRQHTSEILEVVSSLEPLKLHGFGVKIKGLAKYGRMLESADSMSWSFTARRQPPLPGCTGHINCANCIVYALQWYERVLSITPVEVPA